MRVFALHGLILLTELEILWGRTPVHRRVLSGRMRFFRNGRPNQTKRATRTPKPKCAACYSFSAFHSVPPGVFLGIFSSFCASPSRAGSLGCVAVRLDCGGWPGRRFANGEWPTTTVAIRRRCGRERCTNGGRSGQTQSVNCFHLYVLVVLLPPGCTCI